MVWVFFGIGFALAVAGYLYETDYRRRHGDDRLSRYGEMFEGGG